jgi:16S rRNA (adenine1518-N6/adenine1519-N6)-dimethyltransferase
MNLLAVSVQFYAKPEIVSFVSKNCFWPRPKVDSAIIKISNIKEQGTTSNEELFFKIVKAGFSQPRKQIINNLSKKLGIKKEKIRDWLLKNEISPKERAEALTIENWKALVKSFKKLLK